MYNFTPPKKLSPFYKCKRIPRKLKKKYKSILNKYPFLTVSEKIWYLLGYTNPLYKQFLIDEIIWQSDLNKAVDSFQNILSETVIHLIKQEQEQFILLLKSQS